MEPPKSYRRGRSWSGTQSPRTMGDSCSQSYGRKETGPSSLPTPPTRCPHYRKKTFYETLSTMVDTASRTCIVLVGGDFNVKLGECREGEERWIGPHCGRGRPEDQDSDPVEQKRELFLHILRDKDMIAANTWFEQPPARLFTFPGARRHLGPIYTANGNVTAGLSRTVGETRSPPHTVAPQPAWNPTTRP